MGKSARLLGALALAATQLLSCDPFGTGFKDVEPADEYRAKSITPVEPSAVLRVMNYNIKFGGARIDFFFDCYGDRVLMTKDEVIENMEGVAEVIRRADPDILFLQEVDVLSKRSAYVNQVQYLLDHTDLNYGVYGSQWRADYVPSDGLGAVDSGNAILSKYPLTDAERISLPLIDEQGALTNYFYLHRNVLAATVETDPEVRLFATHTEAYAKDGTKEDQIQIFEREMRAAEGLVIGGGDLNTLPPGAKKLHGFPDSVCENPDYIADDYREETHYLEALYEDYQSAIPLDEYLADEEAHFTHTVDGRGTWNRKLDYLFTNANVVPGSGTTHQDASTLGIDTMPLSDHAPITMEIELP